MQPLGCVSEQVAVLVELASTQVVEFRVTPQ
jgi:hypothetical protein